MLQRRGICFAKLHRINAGHASMHEELARHFAGATKVPMEERFGWVILEMDGTEDDIARAVAWLAEQGIQVDRIDEDRETT